MEQLIKKINMIDILGMMLPGGLMLILLEKDTRLLEHLRSTICNESDQVLWSLVFLCISYFVGMLLHESGSVIEKLLWKSPWINPRVHAAVSTGLWDLYIGSSNKTKLRCWQKTLSLLASVITLLAIWLMVWILVGGVCGFKLEIFIGFICVLVVVIISQFSRWGQICGIVFKDAEKKQQIHLLIDNEKYIQKDAGTTEENARKYGLFCGYHSMFRSFLVMVFILQIYIYLYPGVNLATGTSWLVTVNESIHANRMLRFLRYATILAAVLRYWHYACARFSYLYNGYIYNKHPSQWEARSKAADVNTGGLTHAVELIRDAVTEAKRLAKEAGETKKWVEQVQEKAAQQSEKLRTDEKQEIVQDIQNESKAIIDLCQQIKKETDDVMAVRINSHFPVGVVMICGNSASWALKKINCAVDDVARKTYGIGQQMQELQKEKENMSRMLSKLGLGE